MGGQEVKLAIDNVKLNMSVIDLMYFSLVNRFDNLAIVVVIFVSVVVFFSGGYLLHCLFD